MPKLVIALVLLGHGIGHSMGILQVLRLATVLSSAASLVGIAFFPTAFPLFSTIGALVIDIAVLAAVLWYQWVPSDLTA